MIDFLSQSTNQNSCKSRIRRGKWEFADATFTRALLSLQVTPADRIKRSLLRGLMPGKMEAETPWIPWLPGSLAGFLSTYPCSLYIRNIRGRKYIFYMDERVPHHCVVVWSQLTSTRGATLLFCLHRMVADLFCKQQDDKIVANWLQSSVNGITLVGSSHDPTCTTNSELHHSEYGFGRFLVRFLITRPAIPIDLLWSLQEIQKIYHKVGHVSSVQILYKQTCDDPVAGCLSGFTQRT